MTERDGGRRKQPWLGWAAAVATAVAAATSYAAFVYSDRPADFASFAFKTPLGGFNWLTTAPPLATLFAAILLTIAGRGSRGRLLACLAIALVLAVIAFRSGMAVTLAESMYGC